MTLTREELASQITAGWELPRGSGQIARFEQLVSYADAAEDRQSSFEARVGLTSAYHFGDEEGKAFAPFAWCVAVWEDEPELAWAGLARTLRWQYKYVTSSLLKYPSIGLAQTRRVLDQMETRYRRDGQSMRAVYHRRWALADHLGDLETARELYALWVASPRDQNADCLACEIGERIIWLQTIGHDEEAIALASPILEGQIRCATQPGQLLADLLPAYLRTKRFDLARRAHLRGYELIRAVPERVELLARHLEFCAQTGNENRGLDLIERHLPDLGDQVTPRAAMRFRAAASLVLDQINLVGRGAMQVTISPRTEHTAATLAEALRKQALATAYEFDIRNGTTAQSDRVTRTLTLTSAVEHLPLSG